MDHMLLGWYGMTLNIIAMWMFYALNNNWGIAVTAIGFTCALLCGLGLV